MYDSDPGWLLKPQVTNTFYVITLDCDKEYEIAVSASLHNGPASDWSTSWRVKTNSGVTVLYVCFML